MRTAPAGRRLIVSADDLGLHAGINAGVLRGHRDGIVTSASVCANGAAFDDAVRVLKGCDLDVGVHLTLVAEVPLSPPEEIPTLAPRGHFPRYFTTLFHRLLMGRVREQEVEAELRRQVARVCDAGLTVSHLDSHQHVHLHPRILPLVMRVARHFGISRLRAARRVLPARGLRPAALALFARHGAWRARRAGLATPDSFVGIAETGRLDEAALLRLIPRLRAGTAELVCHPGSGDGEISTRYGWGFQWDQELAALCSPLVRAALAEADVSLVSYRDL